MFFFFFSSRRRHTRYIGDWSSDVCSSDLLTVPVIDDWADASAGSRTIRARTPHSRFILASTHLLTLRKICGSLRSEERRVGKECRSRWRRCAEKKNKSKEVMKRTSDRRRL